MLLNDECSSWYNRISDFVVSLGKEEEISYGDESACEVRWTNFTTECKAYGTNAMVVEC